MQPFSPHPVPRSRTIVVVLLALLTVLTIAGGLWAHNQVSPSAPVKKAQKLLYVANNGNGFDIGSTISIVNATTHTVVQTIAADAFVGINKLVFNPQQPRAYLLNNTMIQVLDTTSNTFIGSVGNPSVELFDMVVNPAGTLLYVLELNPNNCNMEDVLAIDAVSLSVVKSVTLQDGACGPLSTLTLNAQGTRLYVNAQGVLFALDAATLATLGGPSGTPGGGAFDMIINPAGTRLYLLSVDTMQVIDTTSLEPIDRVLTGGTHLDPSGGLFPDDLAITPDGSRIYVSNRFSLDVLVIDPSSDTVIATLPIGLGQNYGRLAVSRDGSQVYLANYDADTVTIIDTSTNTVSGIMVVGSRPVAVAEQP